MRMKARAAILGSGNIGTDLLCKALRSDWIEPVWVVGIDPDSDGLKKARAAGMKTTHDGVAGGGGPQDRAGGDEVVGLGGGAAGAGGGGV